MVNNLLSKRLYLSILIILITLFLYFLYRFVLNFYYRLNILKNKSNYKDNVVYGKRISAFIIFGILPILIVKYVFHENLDQYGFAFIHKNVKPVYFFIMLVMVVPIMISLSKRENIYSHYPEVKSATISRLSLLLSSITYILYYFGYEGLFRGFLVFGLRRYTGDLFAVITSMVFTSITHLSSPLIVLIGSMVSGVIFPYIVILSGSIWALFVFHSLIGISMDIFCVRANKSKIVKDIVAGSNNYN